MIVKRLAVFIKAPQTAAAQHFVEQFFGDDVGSGEVSGDFQQIQRAPRVAAGGKRQTLA